MIITLEKLNENNRKIGEGSYGCVYRPGLIEQSYDYVSKVIFDEYSYLVEKLFFQILKKIDTNYSFTLEEKNINNDVELKIEQDIFNAKYNDCNKITNDGYVYLINMEYGGDSLKTIDKTKLLELCNGIKNMINSGLIHSDIKPQNILDNNTKYSLIDFGLSKHKDYIFSIDNKHILEAKYIYFPPEYRIIALLYDFFNDNELTKNYEKLAEYIGKQINYVYENVKTLNNDDSIYNEFETYYSDILYEIIIVLDGNNFFNRDINHLKTEFIDKFFDYKKIDIYSLGVILLQKGYRCNTVSNMIKSDFRLRHDIDTVINEISQFPGGKLKKSSKKVIIGSGEASILPTALYTPTSIENTTDTEKMKKEAKIKKAIQNAIQKGIKNKIPNETTTDQVSPKNTDKKKKCKMQYILQIN